MNDSYQWFWGCIARYAPLYGHVLVASVIINLLSLAMPLFVMNVYDRVVPNNAFESLWVLAIGMMIAASLDFILRIIRMRFVDVAGRNADVKLQSLFLERLMGVRLDALYKHTETKSVGAIIARVRELEYVRDFLGSGTILALTDLPFIVFFIALTFFLGGTLGFIPLLAVPILGLLAYFIQKPFTESSKSQMHANAVKQSFLTELISSLETIRATRMEKVLLHYWERYVGVASDANVHTRAQSSVSTHAISLFNIFLTVSLVVAGVYRISEGLMTTGGLIACVILFGRCAAPMNALVNILANFQKTLLAVKQLHMLMQLPSENPTGDDYALSDELGGTFTAPSLPQATLAVPIVFEKVSFSYPAVKVDTLALRDISMSIYPRARLGFVGASGSGKSTLARLLSGIYVPTEGRIMIGSLDSANTPMRPFRNKVGFLPQEIRIFRGTLRHNIALAWPGEGECDEESLMQAASLAGVMDFAAEHPLGLDMPLGEHGTGLSGGQAQSVALARALLGDPHTLILDEPAAQLDAASEQRLVKRLSTIVANKTVIIFTHKMPMLDLVDRVVALDKGRIVWSGSRQEALAQKKL